MEGPRKKRTFRETFQNIEKDIECNDNDIQCNEKEKKQLLSSVIPSDLGSNSRFYENSETNYKKQEKSSEYSDIKFKLNYFRS